jgi:hypothetical protein
MKWGILLKWQIMGVAVVGRLYGPADEKRGYFRHIEAVIAALAE